MGKSMVQSSTKVRIYLQEWIFNAGICGFLRIILGDVDDLKDQNQIEIGENHIEFERSVFEDFSEKFFETAFAMHGKYDSLLRFFKEKQKDIEQKELSELAKIWKVPSKNQDSEEEIWKHLFDILKKRWSGKTYEVVLKFPGKKGFEFNEENLSNPAFANNFGYEK